ncbi:MAG: CopG family transcriptional regulator [Erysipelotrichaceae bacterium]|nr:CopG family transcriptional regulator [Erysipelotrichaceae bacterium]
MTISLRFSEEDTKLIEDYARANNLNVPDFIRQAVIEKIEDEIDLTVYRRALDESEKNTKTYTLDEVEKELAL